MNETAALCWSAAAIGTIHTLLGPDHYLPFVAMSRAGRWTARKTLTITVLCGVGHVLGSVALGLIGVVLGTAVFRLERIESVRGEIAAWMMIGFGLAYLAWGMVRLIRKRSHSHWHSHDEQTYHCHEHQHEKDHLHVHAVPSDQKRPSMTPWILFTIFLFGPCEPLIPLLMYPAAAGSYWLLGLVTIIFAVATITTMTSIVWLSTSRRLAFGSELMGRFAAPVAGAVVLGCGLAIKLGL